MGKAKTPPAPDYTPVAAASAEAAKYQYQLGKEQLAWAKQTYADDKAISDKVVAAALDRQTINDKNADADRSRYEKIYQPLEDKAAAEAADYATPERQDRDAGRAQAQVQQQFDAQRRNAAASLESFGVDPTSTRFAALDSGMRIQEAAASAGAGNQARAQTEALGRAIRSEAINVGRGYPGQIAGTYGTALQSGNSAVNAELATTGSGANTIGTQAGSAQIGNQAVGTWGNTLNQGYSNALDAYKAKQSSSSGLGSILGAGLGIAANSGFAFADGGGVPPNGSPPNGDTPGGQVPAGASPTRGRAIDDVPARLTAGEFVMPKEAVSWYGEKHFQNLIQKSRKERDAATAKPKFSPEAALPPAFVSRPGGASAIPA